MSSETTSPKSIKRWALRASGYLLLLVQTTPFVWAGMMTFPLIGYIIMLFFGGAASSPFSSWIVGLLLSPTICTAVFDIGLVIWIYSVFYLFRRKKHGLVSSGIYRYIRHPQYLGVILFTSSLTASSYWLLTHTFGMSYIDAPQTILLWFVMVFCYLGLAFAEESFLIGKDEQDYSEYQSRTSMFFPFMPRKDRKVEGLITIVLFALLLYVQIITFNAIIFLAQIYH